MRTHALHNQADKTTHHTTHCECIQVYAAKGQQRSIFRAAGAEVRRWRWLRYRLQTRKTDCLALAWSAYPDEGQIVAKRMLIRISLPSDISWHHWQHEINRPTPVECQCKLDLLYINNFSQPRFLYVHFPILFRNENWRESEMKGGNNNNNNNWVEVKKDERI